MDYTQIYLDDPEFQQTYTLTVTNSDAMKAEHGLNENVYVCSYPPDLTYFSRQTFALYGYESDLVTSDLYLLYMYWSCNCKKGKVPFASIICICLLFVICLFSFILSLVCTDLSYATALLNYARQHANENGVVMDTASSSTSLATDVEEDTATAVLHADLDEEFVDDMGSANFRWSHEAILFLLEEYRKRERDMYSGKISHKKAWEQIAQVMNSKGHTVTSRQCTTQINTMKRTYKAVRDHNKKSGNNKRPWKYFEVMESLLGEKPYMEPLATISSTGAETFKIKSQAASLISTSGTSCSSSICENEALNMNICMSRKRKIKDLETVEEIRKIAEEKQNRHKQKMEATDKLMERLDKILEKLT